MQQEQQAAAAVPATSLTPDEWSPSAAVSPCKDAMQSPTAVLAHLQLPTPTPMSLCTPAKSQWSSQLWWQGGKGKD